jgi:hypothetical protein
MKFLSGVVTTVGSILFLVGAFLPISARVYPQPSPAKRLESITAAQGQWLTSQVLLALGATITVIGVALYAYHLRHETYVPLVWASVAFLTAGLIPWLWQVHLRAVDPSWFAEGLYPMWPYLLYFIATEVGLAIFGVALLSGPHPAWLGWVVIITMLLLAILTVIFRDMMPLAFYLITILAGVMLLR